MPFNILYCLYHINIFWSWPTNCYIILKLRNPMWTCLFISTNLHPSKDVTLMKKISEQHCCIKTKKPKKKTIPHSIFIILDNNILLYSFRWHNTQFPLIFLSHLNQNWSFKKPNLSGKTMSNFFSWILDY
jgi:hypothetical protein